MKRQGFIKGSAILLAMVLITKILGLLYKIPLTNLLGGTGMGYFASAFSVFTPVFAIVVSGIPSTMARLTAENYADNRVKKKCSSLFKYASFQANCIFSFHDYQHSRSCSNDTHLRFSVTQCSRRAKYKICSHVRCPIYYFLYHYVSGTRLL